MRSLPAIPAIGLLLLFEPGLGASSFDRGARGGISASFLKNGAGARAAGLGEAYTALADEASALYWNPAAMARIPGGSLTLMHSAYLDSSFYDYGAAVQRLGLGAVGVGFQYMSHGGVDRTDEAGVSLGRITPNDHAVTLGLAAPWWGLSFGISAKYVSSRLAKSASTGAVDLGVLTPWLLEDRLSLGFSALNLGGDLKFDEEEGNLPVTMRLGGAYRLTESWLLCLDVVSSRDNAPQAALGTEYRLISNGRFRFALRAGYNSRSAGDIDGATGIAGGFGVGLGDMAVDYAFVPMGAVGLTQRMSLSYRWGSSGALPSSKKEKEREEERPPAEQAAVEQAPAAPPPRADVEQPAPERADAHLDAARQAIKAKRFKRAELALERALRLTDRDDSGRARYFQLLGSLALAKGEVEHAKAHFKEAIRKASALGFAADAVAEAYYGLGLCHVQAGDIPQAKEAFEKAVGSGPSERTRDAVELELLKLKAAGN